MIKMSKNLKALKPRRKTRVVKVGNIGIGGNEPIRVQTMTNTDTLDVNATVEQIFRCVKAGAELVRVTTQTPRHAKAVGEIKKKLLKKYNCSVPIIADTHFTLESAFEALKWADKVRINPGLFGTISNKSKLSAREYKEVLRETEEAIIPFIQAAKKEKKPIRIGSNHGSLSERILERYGNTAEGMVESAMEYLRIFKKHKFNDVVVALKANNPLLMIEANRLLAKTLEKENMNYPIHLGVTSAGSSEDGRAKSTLGIGVPLLEGIGDTIRVSLTEPPENEIPVCYSILQATQRRITKTEFISCPSCGRTLFDIEKVTNRIKDRLSNLQGVKIAVMGCVVNGPGEMADADFGYVGGSRGQVSLYYKEECVQRNISEKNAIEMLEKLIKEKRPDAFKK